MHNFDFLSTNAFAHHVNFKVQSNSPPLPSAGAHDVVLMGKTLACIRCGFVLEPAKPVGREHSASKVPAAEVAPRIGVPARFAA